MWSDSACSVGVQCNFRTLSTNPYITQAVIQGAYTLTTMPMHTVPSYRLPCAVAWYIILIVPYA